MSRSVVATEGWSDAAAYPALVATDGFGPFHLGEEPPPSSQFSVSGGVVQPPPGLAGTVGHRVRLSGGVIQGLGLAGVFGVVGGSGPAPSGARLHKVLCSRCGATYLDALLTRCRRCGSSLAGAEYW